MTRKKKEKVIVTPTVTTKKKKRNKKKKSKNLEYFGPMRKPAMVEAPAASAVVVASPIKTRPTFFTKMEPIATITGTTTSFAVVGNYSLNPGLAATFSWLAAPAQAFNLYRFRRLRIRYLNSTNTVNTGVVVIGFNPDPNDPPPTTLQQIENYETRVRVATWEDSYVDVPKADLNRLNKFLVRDALVPGELSIYDIGSLFVACSGNASSTATLGEVWVEYQVELFSPVVTTGVIPVGKANSVFATALIAALGASTVIPFGITLDNALGLVNNAGSFTGIRGAMIVYAQVTLNANTLTSATIAIVKNGTNVIGASYGAMLPALNGTATANVEGYVSMLPSDVLTIVVTQTGTAVGAAPFGSQNSILVFTAA